MTVTELPSSLQQLIRAIEGLERFSVNAVRETIKANRVPREDLKRWERFDHPAEDSYGRAMIYHGGTFEVMLMSWLPGDLSAIHDHGYTQWGAVCTYGEAEHATFLALDDEITTLTRTRVKAGEVIGVGHQLVHQMGCPTDGEAYVSLHVYGAHESLAHITADARIFDLTHGNIQVANGGAFFNLPESEIKELQAAPEPDFPTWLRNTTELLLRQRKSDATKETQTATEEALFSVDRLKDLQQFLNENIDENGHATRSGQWNVLEQELKAAAALQNELLRNTNQNDRFNTYAKLYDEVIGKPCLHNFMAGYLRFFIQERYPDFEQASLLSIGCGTGLVERYMIDELGLPREQLYGIDISDAMIKVASQYINAEIGDALTLDPAVRQWDIAFCGLNVFQYIGHQKLQDVIANVATVVKPGGYFIGDFITPDHIRWYPNVIYSADRRIISLRTPTLIEKDNFMYQRSRIFNVRTNDGQLHITYEGDHERFLPPLSRVRHYFDEAFSEVDLYDAVSLQPIAPGADTCPSTRYVVIAKR